MYREALAGCCSQIGKKGTSMSSNTFSRTTKRFAKETRGSVTVEFILWVPIIFLFWFAAIQVSLLFVTQSNYFSVARETARLVARHALDTTQAEAYALSQAALFGGTPSVTVAVTGNIVNVGLSIPALEVTSLNPLGFSLDYQITAQVAHTMEPI